MNGIISLVSFRACLLLVRRKVTDFCAHILHPAKCHLLWEYFANHVFFNLAFKVSKKLSQVYFCLKSPLPNPFPWPWSPLLSQRLLPQPPKELSLPALFWLQGFDLTGHYLDHVLWFSLSSKWAQMSPALPHPQSAPRYLTSSSSPCLVFSSSGLLSLLHYLIFMKWFV